MNFIFKILKFFLLIVLLAIINIGFSYLIPYPFSKLNIVFAILVSLFFWNESGLVVWAAFFVSLIVELYTTTPFGVVLISNTLGILFAYWLYKWLFTNRSWYAMAALSLVSISLYRLLYISMLLFFSIFIDSLIIPWNLVLINSAWELLFTSTAIVLFYFMASFFFKKNNSQINSKYFFDSKLNL